jgi:hypothetical protein
MSEFSQRIRDARLELAPSRPRLVAAGGPRIADALRPPPQAAGDRTSLEELEAQRRRVEVLARKVDELNAAILSELVQHPDALSGSPSMVAELGRSSASAQRACPA